jgi:hypothetical protein
MEPNDLVSFHLRIDASLKTILEDGKIERHEIPRLVLLLSELIMTSKAPKMTPELLTTKLNEMYAYVMSHYNLYPADELDKVAYKRMFDIAVKLAVYNPRLIKETNSCLSCMYTKN